VKDVAVNSTPLSGIMFGQLPELIIQAFENFFIISFQSLPNKIYF
jgi:hypothetical protein